MPGAWKGALRETLLFSQALWKVPITFFTLSPPPIQRRPWQLSTRTQQDQAVPVLASLCATLCLPAHRSLPLKDLRERMPVVKASYDLPSPF